MGDMPLMLCIVACLVIVVALMLLFLLFSLVSLLVSMALRTLLPRVSEQLPLSPTMRVSAEDGPLTSLGLHTVLGALVSSASSLDVLTICLGARRLGGP